MESNTLKWTEMSYYRVEKERNETVGERLRSECSEQRTVYENIDRNYSKFFEDDYSEEGEV